MKFKNPIEFLKSKKSLRVFIEKQTQAIENSGKALIFTVVGSIILMFAAAIAIFFTNVQGEEKVMVPDVVGKNIYTGLFELEQKELYGKIQFRDSETGGDEGKIIAQDPVEGSIVKAYRRITLTVSRGATLDNLPDYTGSNYNDTVNKIELHYAGEVPLIKIKTPIYLTSEKNAGTIIAQYPEPDTAIIDPIEVQFIVSAGNEVHQVTVPEVEGKSISQLLELMKTSKVVFDFTNTYKHEKTFKASCENAGKKLDPYSRVKAELSFKIKEDADKTTSGIFSFNLPEYPFPVPVKLDCLDSEGIETTVIDFTHPGKSITIPYEVKKGSTLSLTVNGEMLKKEVVQ
ncbi:PASTA domain-containing protein [Treponema sp.]|uniref:PASTA domain-containing protein n=1 Tax=Treponema sp. TaxID=166 RepID=UPI00257A69A6|nr:PASTA domain-containing protein [Treponema sp.]MBE6355369.1 PASTA domain-containing protein [Treponema sp.]